MKRIGCLKCEEDIEHFSCIAKNEAELGSIDRKLKLQNSERALFSCDLCSFQTNYTLRVKNHTESVHQDIKRFACSICAYESYYKHILRYHLKYQHPDDEVKPIKRIGCGACEENAVHRRCVINGRRRWAPSVSQKKGKNESKLSEELYKCEQCNFESNELRAS